MFFKVLLGTNDPIDSIFTICKIYNYSSWSESIEETFIELFMSSLKDKFSKVFLIWYEHKQSSKATYIPTITTLGRRDGVVNVPNCL